MSSQTVAHNGDTVHRLGDWRDATRVFLQPIAAPSILGLFGFAGATFMVAAHLAHWHGNSLSFNYIWPFAATFGGIAQFASRHAVKRDAAPATPQDARGNQQYDRRGHRVPPRHAPLRPDSQW